MSWKLSIEAHSHENQEYAYVIRISRNRLCNEPVKTAAVFLGLSARVSPHCVCHLKNLQNVAHSGQFAHDG